MNIFKAILIAIAVTVTGTIAPIALSATKIKTLEASPNKIVLLVYLSSISNPDNDIAELVKKGAKHCGRYDKIVGQKSASLNIGSPTMIITIFCDAAPEKVKKQLNEKKTESPEISKKRSRLLKSWE